MTPRVPYIYPSLTPPCPHTAAAMSHCHTPSLTNPNSHFQSIFDQALQAYKNTTGNDLHSHPLFRDLTACNSAGAILIVLQRRFPAYDQPGTSQDTSTEWLPTSLDVINQVLQTIGAGVSLVSPKSHETGQGQDLISLL